MGVKLRAVFEAFEVFLFLAIEPGDGKCQSFPITYKSTWNGAYTGDMLMDFSIAKSIFHSERLGMKCQSQGGHKKYSSFSTLMSWCWISKFASEQWLVPPVSMHMAYALHVLNAPVFVITSTLSACLSLYHITHIRNF